MLLENFLTPLRIELIRSITFSLARSLFFDISLGLGSEARFGSILDITVTCESFLGVFIVMVVMQVLRRPIIEVQVDIVKLQPVTADYIRDFLSLVASCRA